MQIKKVDWIHRPEKVRMTGRTLTFTPSTDCAALYTLGENERLLLRTESAGVSFLMLHTATEYVHITNDHIAMSMHGTKSVIGGAFGRELVIEKKGAEIRFIQNEKEIAFIEDAAFSQSASFGFFIKAGETETTLFFA